MPLQNQLQHLLDLLDEILPQKSFILWYDLGVNARSARSKQKDDKRKGKCQNAQVFISRAFYERTRYYRYCDRMASIFLQQPI